MDFFDIGFEEVLLVLLIALIVWGPGRLVSVGRTVGRTAHAFRKAAADLTTELDREILEEEKQALPARGKNDGEP